MGRDWEGRSYCVLWQFLPSRGHTDRPTEILLDLNWKGLGRTQLLCVVAVSAFARPHGSAHRNIIRLKLEGIGKDAVIVCCGSFCLRAATRIGPQKYY